MGGKKLAKQLYQKQTKSATKKFGKKIVGKKFEKSFFIFARMSYQKNGGINRAKQFFQKHKNSATKKCKEKNRRKKVRKSDFIFARMSNQKWAENTRGTIFPETQE